MGNILNNKKLIIFDFDGLLVNTEEIYLKGWEEAFHYYKITISREILLKFYGNSIENVNQVLLSTGISPEIIKKVRAYREKIINKYLVSSKIRLLPGVIDFLELVHSNYTLVVCTSSPRKRVDRILGYSNLTKYFNNIITFEDTLYHKPHPQPYMFILDSYKVKASDVIAFEDSISGIISSQRSGIEVHCVNSLITDEIRNLLTPFQYHKSFTDVIELL